MKRSSVVIMRKKDFGSHCLAVIPAGFLLFFVILFLGTRLFLRADADRSIRFTSIIQKSGSAARTHFGALQTVTVPDMRVRKPLSMMSA